MTASVSEVCKKLREADVSQPTGKYALLLLKSADLLEAHERLRRAIIQQYGSGDTLHYTIQDALHALSEKAR